MFIFLVSCTTQNALHYIYITTCNIVALTEPEKKVLTFTHMLLHNAMTLVAMT